VGNPTLCIVGSEGSTAYDVRELQRRLKAEGIQLLNEADESSTGPAHIMAVDPDGNPILVDQHVNRWPSCSPDCQNGETGMPNEVNQTT